MSRAVPGPEDQQARDAGGAGTGCAAARCAATGAAAGCAAAGGGEAVVGPGRPPGPAPAALAGLRPPVIWALLAIAFFTAISGKPVDGVLMLIVAAGLAWDAGHRALRHAGGGPKAARPGRPGAPSPHGRRVGGRRRLLAIGALVAGGVGYAAVMGSFTRYSWPVTAGIIGLGTVVVLIGWHGPVRDQPDERLPVAGTLAWLVVLVAGGLWELGALLAQRR